MPRMLSLSRFNSSSEKICKNLKTLKLCGTNEPLIVDILKKCQKIEEFTLSIDRLHCKSFFIFFH